MVELKQRVKHVFNNTKRGSRSSPSKETNNARVRQKKLTYPSSITSGAKYEPDHLESSGSESEDDYDSTMMPLVCHSSYTEARKYILNEDALLSQEVPTVATTSETSVEMKQQQHDEKATVP
jgi:hypothetical protein